MIWISSKKYFCFVMVFALSLLFFMCFRICFGLLSVDITMYALLWLCMWFSSWLMNCRIVSFPSFPPINAFLYVGGSKWSYSSSGK